MLRVAAGLSMPGFSPDGLAVFGVEGDRLTIGHHGQRPGDESPFTQMSLQTDYPAAEVACMGGPSTRPHPSSTSRATRSPGRWPRTSAASPGRSCCSTVAGRTMGAWMAAFTYPVAFTPDERSVLTTVARMLAQALTRAGAAETQRELTEGLQRSMLPAGPTRRRRCTRLPRPRTPRPHR
ncbi:SpoIIE family protein phosphatase [Streptomyces tanashiensis]